MKKIGGIRTDNFFRLLEKHGYTNVSFSRRAGCSYQYLNTIKKTGSMSDEKAAEFAGLLGEPLREFYRGFLDSDENENENEIMSECRQFETDREFGLLVAAHRIYKSSTALDPGQLVIKKTVSLLVVEMEQYTAYRVGVDENESRRTCTDTDTAAAGPGKGKKKAKK